MLIKVGEDIMSQTIIIEKDRLKFPKTLLKKLHLRNGQKLIVETATDNTIQIKPIKENNIEVKLLKLIENPVHMGKIKYRNRKDIYNDIN